MSPKIESMSDADLLALLVDEADLWHTDAPIDTCFLISNRSSPTQPAWTQKSLRQPVHTARGTP